MICKRVLRQQTLGIFMLQNSKILLSILHIILAMIWVESLIYYPLCRQPQRSGRDYASICVFQVVAEGKKDWYINALLLLPSLFFLFLLWSLWLLASSALVIRNHVICLSVRCHQRQKQKSCPNWANFRMVKCSNWRLGKPRSQMSSVFPSRDTIHGLWQGGCMIIFIEPGIQIIISPESVCMDV